MIPSQVQTIKQLSTILKKSLTNIYDDKELNSIIYILFEHYLGFSKTDCILQSDYIIDNNIIVKLFDDIKRLQQHTPIQYIIGKAFFYNLSFYVNHDVLIPRQETEELVNWIINDIASQKLSNKIKIIDIGTGSGCIAIALKKNINFAEVFAIEINENALNIAKNNALYNNTIVNFINYDILSNNIFPIKDKFDIIVSNPPYVAEKEKVLMNKNVINFEPHQALFVRNEDPLIFYKSILEFSHKYLNNNGHIYFEINENYGEDVIELLKTFCFRNATIKKDMQNKNRMVHAIYSQA